MTRNDDLFPKLNGAFNVKKLKKKKSVPRRIFPVLYSSTVGLNGNVVPTKMKDV